MTKTETQEFEFRNLKFGIQNSKHCGSSSVDRALAFQAEGRGFEPRLPLSRKKVVCFQTTFFLRK